jgi:hypothetical protein
LLERAALDGHAALPLPLVLSALGADAVAEALATGAVVGDERWLALDGWATAEESIADEAAGLAAEGRLAVVLGRTPETAEAYVVGDVHRRSLLDVAADLQAAPDGPVVVAGEPDLLAAPAAGSLLPALTAWGEVPVHDLRARAASSDDALGRLAEAVARGELPEPDPADRSVVVVGCGTDEEVVGRVRQLVEDSVPRVYAVAAADVLVVTPSRRGDSGAVALAAALDGPRVVTVHDVAFDELPVADAVVAVLPAACAGILTRPLVATLARLGRRHLSVVTAAGDALPRAVVDDVARPRWSRLPDLLAAARSAWEPGPR